MEEVAGTTDRYWLLAPWGECLSTCMQVGGYLLRLLCVVCFCTCMQVWLLWVVWGGLGWCKDIRHLRQGVC